MRKMTTPFGIALSLLFSGALVLSPLWAQDPDLNPGLISEPPSTGGPPGGQYRGPQDIVPSPNSICNQSAPSLCGFGEPPSSPWGQCSYLDQSWIVQDEEQCVSCDGNGAPCFKAKGYSLNLSALWDICPEGSIVGNPYCSPGPGNLISTCLKVENVCQVNVFESLWLNPVGFGLTPICEPVPLQVFVNGLAVLQPPQSFSRQEINGLNCGPATVCLTFPADCLCDAVDRWTTAVWPYPDNYANKWMFHLGFTTCESCDC